MRKTAIVTAFDPQVFRGGIETYSLQLADLLEDHGVETDIIHPDQYQPEYRFRNEYLGRLYNMGRQLLQKKNEYDIFVVNSFYGLGMFPPPLNTTNIYHLTHIGFAEAVKGRVAESLYLELRYLWGEFGEAASAADRRAVAVSESVKKELAQHYQLPDAEIVENAIDTELFCKHDRAASRAKWNVKKDAFTGLYVGRWNLLKGSDILEEVIRARPDIQWILVIGSGERDLIPVFENVTVLEEVDHRLMPEIYSTADFLFFPSRYEGFGFVIVEAMSCGLPVITTNVGIAKTICTAMPFSELLLPDINNSETIDLLKQISSRIDLLRDDQGLRETCAAEGRRLIENRYNILKWKEKMLHLLGVGK